MGIRNTGGSTMEWSDGTASLPLMGIRNWADGTDMDWHNTSHYPSWGLGIPTGTFVEFTHTPHYPSWGLGIRFVFVRSPLTSSSLPLMGIRNPIPAPKVIAVYCSLPLMGIRNILFQRVFGSTNLLITPHGD